MVDMRHVHIPITFAVAECDAMEKNTGIPLRHTRRAPR
ncbi:hypothetical protein MM2B1231_4011 [Mycobacteroides abscessus subsp. bolletii 2B-1231]|uniref:Uncharacterized protein n=1 Tax=Mycobacteroides abscessus MAB_091912_2446 TaxID=1335414 RepID=A0A829MAU9_9MYCO|nr:hypothetical protein MM2B0626_3949 [Mycobacteroides abscessus subsp. bolletii 2B-0626]EIV04032.1 hypothetical protein MM2B0912R_4264 [Mycobacteroides abscessus subsp. bolletii 2B-0912-R]EIV18447.1 hypothetical protein MM2B0912S_3952 [Mycobacteroides abscessus subsp. bolletii 2B-0912-S]EIV65256.1 hypothetical protein MMCCUG48898_4173 [Mycobacteroides abscessus subsp. massiliense CCUG 48898 = JCM 15300]EIV72279.1 hypothetical protein MM2B1231_4011 [Mycobacteroides abscessus subsp. bolletii 2B-